MTYSKFPLLKKRKSEGITLENFKSEFNYENLLKSHVPLSGFKSILNSYTTSSGRNDFKELIKRIEFSRKAGYPILFSMGADIITNGLSPLVIDLMQRGWISAISIDEDFLIKDFEVALAGKFIDYKNSFVNNPGIKGLAEETGLFLNIAYKEGVKKERGAGESVGEYLSSSKFKFNEYSILANGYRLNIPIILHSIPGTSKLHYHPNFDGGTLGKLLDRDFILFSSIISNIGDNGVFVGMGIKRAELDILINSIGFCIECGTEFKRLSIAITGDIDGKSLSRDIEKMKAMKNVSLFLINGNPDLLLPIIASLLLEEV